MRKWNAWWRFLFGWVLGASLSLGILTLANLPIHNFVWGWNVFGVVFLTVGGLVTDIKNDIKQKKQKGL